VGGILSFSHFSLTFYFCSYLVFVLPPFLSRRSLCRLFSTLVVITMQASSWSVVFALDELFPRDSRDY